MKISESAIRLREMINRAIEDNKLKRDEYDEIIALAMEDGVIDIHEKALLSQLQDMIEDRTIRLTAD